jgi:hypothetical protein
MAGQTTKVLEAPPWQGIFSNNSLSRFAADVKKSSQLNWEVVG